MKHPIILYGYKAQTASKGKALLPHPHIINWALHLCPFILLSKYFLENGTELNLWQPPGLFTLSIALEMSGSNYFEKVHSPEWRWRVLNVFRLVNSRQLKVREGAAVNEKEMHKRLGSATATFDDHSGIKGMLRRPQNRDSSFLRGDGKGPALFLDRPIPWHVGLEELQFLFSQTVPWTPKPCLWLDRAGTKAAPITSHRRGAQQLQDSCGEAGKWFII